MDIRAGLAGTVVVAFVMAGCGRPTQQAAATDGSTPVVVQLDWFAEPEHGGFFQAEARGWYREAGLDVTLLPGGPNANVHQKLATNQVQFGQSDSTNTLQAIAQGLPLINVAAVFQDDPSVLMLHKENPVSSFEELDGKTIMARPEWVFLSYLRKKYGIDFNVVPQSFGLGQFVADPSLIQQGFYIAEPFFLEKERVYPKFLHTWDAGYLAYVVVVGNRDWITAHPEATRAFVGASIRGWRDYLEGDPKPAHERMLELNDKATPEYLQFSRRMIIDEKLVTGREAGTENIGRITRDRFQNQIGQLEGLGVIPRGAVTVERAMDDSYLPPGPR
ncbi:MAG: ABC transporter substrate-binding protein [Opitutaceae bacterium]